MTINLGLAQVLGKGLQETSSFWIYTFSSVK